jgi:hypothetical protein
LPTGPGIGTRLRLVLLYDIHAIDRFPRVQDCGSSWRLVQCAKAAAGASAPRAPRAVRPTSKGLFLRLRCCACASIPRGNPPWLVWRIGTARATPSPSWPTSWRGPFMTGATAKPPWLWSSSATVQGAERVRRTPHWTRTGSAASARPRRLGGLRLCTRQGPPRPCIPEPPAVAWTRALAPAQAAIVAQGTCAAPLPSLPLTGAPHGLRPPCAWDGTRGQHDCSAAEETPNGSLLSLRQWRPSRNTGVVQPHPVGTCTPQ